jgi:nicotinamidase-related amidase
MEGKKMTQDPKHEEPLVGQNLDTFPRETQEKNTRALFIIDPQNCFMDFVDRQMPLPVSGALTDMMRLTNYVFADPKRFDAIYVTLDTHPEDHISHANRWVDVAGNNPDPFTLITHGEYKRKIWRAAKPTDQVLQDFYLRRLEEEGRIHTVWPIHGQKDEFEHQVESNLKSALNSWEVMTGKKVIYIEKGMHRDTEQFGIFAATVPLFDAPETYLNHSLINEINRFGAVEFAGEASSHCAKDSIEQYLGYLPEIDRYKVTVLRDTMSPVSAVVDTDGVVLVDFPAQAEAWLQGLPERGIKVETVEFQELMGA